MKVFHFESSNKNDGKTIMLDTLLMKNVLVIGGGGREHAIVDALSRSRNVGKIFCAPGNAGIAAQAECVPLKETQIPELVEFAKENGIDLTVVGPEVPLSAGIADAFEKAGLRIFGPSAAAARIESSKDFAKCLMEKYGIPTAEFKTFDNYKDAIEYVGRKRFPIVLKYDGLAAGKGVVIPETFSDAQAALKDMLLDDKFGKGKVVIEEYLTGPEFSFMCFVNGEEVFPLAIAQDHKRAYEGDKGPNTGGMGAYSPVPVITAEDEAYALENIMKKTAAAMVAEGCPFKGLLYGGLMKTPDGIKVIEFNCRFGDPETEVVLPRLESDIYEIFCAVTDGGKVVNAPAGTDSAEGLKLSSAELMPEIKWSDNPVLGFVMASKGYPGSYEKGFEITGLEDALADPAVRIYQMGTKSVVKEGSEEPSLVTSGGRVLMVVASGETLRGARDKALAAVRKIHCDNLFYRSDIGHLVL
jgi:phosphoribosylamine---glycine ligase